MKVYNNLRDCLIYLMDNYTENDPGFTEAKRNLIYRGICKID